MMPATLTYPGVYIEEIPSGVRTITGVATSITAFVGRARRGERDHAVTINSYGDFERHFGPLWEKSNLGYAVRDFYLNGGSQAIVVRLYHDTANVTGIARLDFGGLTLEAASPGAWGNGLRGEVVKDGISQDVADRLGVAVDKVFNLTLTDTGPGGSIESFLNVTTEESPRRIDRVLKAESRLALWSGVYPSQAPTVTAGKDAVTVAAEALPDLKKKLDDAKKALADAMEADPTGTHPTEEDAVTKAQKEYDDGKTAVAAAITNMGGSDGEDLALTDFLPQDGQSAKKGLYALEQADLFNLLCIPPYKPTGLEWDVDNALLPSAAAYCEERRAFLLVDSPSSWKNKSKAVADFSSDAYPGVRSKNGAIFFPRIVQPNPLRDQQMEEFAPCGVVAGVFARTDTERGVWKAPAGISAALVNVPKLAVNLTDMENGELNLLGVNCLRAFPVIGRVLWGSRTLRGADQLADEWKYIPVRRTALFIEESLFRGTKWVVFEPNDEPLWAQIRLNVGAFMHGLFRQGAFQGQKPRDAYFVKCDKETTTQDDINKGIVNIIVGFAPLKPAEFVVIKIQQMAGEIET
jgi:uncharacterized protein